MEKASLVDTFKLNCLRAIRSDFGRDSATEEERASLAQSDTPVTRPLAQDYAAWRFSVLTVAAALLILGALIQLVSFETVSDSMVDQQVAMIEANGQVADEDMVLQQLEMQWGADNLELLDMIPVITILAFILVTVLAVLATRAWRDVQRSARLARYGWYVLIGAPLLLAVLPWARMLDFSHLPNPGNAKMLTQSVGMVLGLTFFMTLAPKLLSVFPGIIRASVSLKTMLHESPVPGYTVVIFAPVYAMFLLVVFTTIIQVQGNLWVMLGLACLLIAPLIYVLRAGSFVRPHTAEESGTLVSGVRKQALLFNSAGVVLLTMFLLSLDNVSFFQVLQFMIVAGGGVLLMMVVAADFVLALLRLEHEQAKQFVGSDMATQFEDKLQSLAAERFNERKETEKEVG